jgi:hypothetical protein
VAAVGAGSLAGKRCGFPLRAGVSSRSLLRGPRGQGRLRAGRSGGNGSPEACRGRSKSDPGAGEWTAWRWAQGGSPEPSPDHVPGSGVISGRTFGPAHSLPGLTALGLQPGPQRVLPPGAACAWTFELKYRREAIHSSWISSRVAPRRGRMVWEFGEMPIRFEPLGARSARLLRGIGGMELVCPGRQYARRWRRPC